MGCYIFHKCFSAAITQTPIPGLGSQGIPASLKASLSDAMEARQAGRAGAPSCSTPGAPLLLWLEGLRSTQHLGGLALHLLMPLV